MEALIKSLRHQGVSCMAGDKEGELLLRQQNAGFEHIHFAGVDTHKLQEAMRQINWTNHPDHSITAIEAFGNKELSDMYSVFQRLRKLENDYCNHNEEGQFLIHAALTSLYQWHFTGTPVEQLMLAESTYNRHFFYHSYKIPKRATADQIIPMISKRELLDKFCEDPRFALPEISYKGLPDDYTRLKEQLAGLGFVSKNLDRYLQMQLSERAKHFCIVHEESRLQALFEIEYRAKTYELVEYDAKYQNKGWIFSPNVSRNEALIRINQLYHLNKISMNTQIVDQLKKTLKNLGFGEKMNEKLEKNIKDELPEFTLNAQHEFNQKKVDYTLHFRAGEERYFFNKFDAAILNADPAKEINQTFKINKGNGVTAKEAFNLMEGRAVEKLVFKDDERYHAWFQLDKDKTNANGKEIRQFHENYGYDIEKVLLGHGIKEMNEAKSTEELLYSLKKGNVQQIHVDKDGEEKKYFVSANPQFKTIDLFDHQMKKVHREELLGPEQKTSKSVKQNNEQQVESKKKQSKVSL